MVDGLFFCATLTGREAIPHFYKLESGLTATEYIEGFKL